MRKHSGRRRFLKAIGAVAAGGAASTIPVDGAVEAKAPQAAGESAAPIVNAYTFLTAPEAAFVEAAVNLMIPADDLTPSGTDCGVTVFIDRQLAGAWGKGDRL